MVGETQPLPNVLGMIVVVVVVMVEVMVIVVVVVVFVLVAVVVCVVVVVVEELELVVVVVKPVLINGQFAYICTQPLLEEVSGTTLLQALNPRHRV